MQFSYSDWSCGLWFIGNNLTWYEINTHYEEKFDWGYIKHHKERLTRF